jgi:flagellar basal body-associated protein FliL
MWRFLVLLLACVLAVVLPPAIGHAASAATEDQGPVDVALPPILAPMVVQNQLAGYAYITVALAPSGRDKVAAIREKMPFLQDAFLREVNKASILRADDAKAVDAEAIKARLTARMNQILPKGTVGELKLQQIVLALFKS